VESSLTNEDVEHAFCDGDVWAYRIGFAGQHTPPAQPFPWFTVVWGLDETIDKVKRKYPKAKIHICMTDEKNNYRESIAVTSKYKGGRLSSKPYWWRKLRDHIYTLDETIVSVNEEADDIMSKGLVKYGDKAVCVTVDKDLKNTFGRHFNDSTGVEVIISPERAYQNFYTQMVVGDRVDNIQGLKGHGVVSAWHLFEDCKTPEEYEEALLPVYDEVYGNGEEVMIEMGRLLWMRRVDDELWDLRKNGFTTIEGADG
jgi:hypothetical protein